jgi:hypothetical protein
MSNAAALLFVAGVLASSFLASFVATILVNRKWPD